jgi:hypothetical protein
VKTRKGGFESAACTSYIGILREFMGTYRILCMVYDYKTGVLTDLGSLEIPRFKPEFYFKAREVTGNFHACS